jgi:hypothetical protein
MPEGNKERGILKEPYVSMTNYLSLKGGQLSGVF